MRMERDRGATGPLISGFSSGGFRVDGNVYTALLITPRRADGWAPPPIKTLGLDAILSLVEIDPRPEFVIIGTGATLVRPPSALVAALDDRGIGVEAMDSRAAARTWGVLRGEGRWITCALYPLLG